MWPLLTELWALMKVVTGQESPGLVERKDNPSLVSLVLHAK